jgi:uncharacterized membrane protein YccC
MPLLKITGLRPALAKMQGRRGMRAGLAVGVAMFVCVYTHRPMGWAALGSLYVCLVDNGGPYRLRFGNMLAVFLSGAFAVLIGSIAGVNLYIGLPVTLAFCFFFTLARVIAPPMAASSVFVLICYVVAYGHTEHGLAIGLTSAIAYLLGGVWAAALALVLWPVDPFRPAREAVAEVYAVLLELCAALPATGEPEGHRHFNTLLARTRLHIEAAQSALTATPARGTARTVRARNLTVLTESADLLLARILRIAELSESSRNTLQAADAWLAASLAPIEAALRERPLDDTKAFSPSGSLSLELHRSEPLLEATLQADPTLRPDARAPLNAALRDTLFNLEVAFESVRALWTGSDSRQREASQLRAAISGQSTALFLPMVWLESLRSNFTLRSLTFRYAVRMAAVVAVDTVLMRYIHVTHGYWLAMTSLIVLRPFAGETVRKSAERVAGTVAGGIFAAAVTAVFSSHNEILAIVVLSAAGSVALYAVDYAWYCFFLTPTIVLLTLPRMHDWNLALARTEMTVLGAVVAVAAMLLLWPERESLQLPRLLARAAAADAAYLRSMLTFWHTATGKPRASRIDAERALLAPARRLCGLAVNDAEDTLDHALLEHDLPLNPHRHHTAHLNSAALTFTTYLRRITRTTTTLAAVGLGESGLDTAGLNTTGLNTTGLDTTSDSTTPLVTNLATRLERLDRILRSQSTPNPLLATDVPIPIITTELPPNLAGDQLRRLERQVSILERTAAEIAAL